MTKQSIQAQKKLIRQQVRGLRKNISSEYSTIAGQALLSNLEQLASYQSAQKIACFLSFDGEISTQAVIADIWASSKICYLPKIRPNPKHGLWFLPFSFNSELSANHLGIPEINSPLNLAEAVSSLDLILMPLVAFDAKANRLGMGGGYYDATLAHLAKIRRKPRCIGLAFDRQKVDQVPTNNRDFRLDGIVTESHYYPMDFEMHVGGKRENLQELRQTK